MNLAIHLSKRSITFQGLKTSADKELNSKSCTVTRSISMVSKSIPSLMSSKRSSDDIITSSTIGSSSSSRSPDPRRLKSTHGRTLACITFWLIAVYLNKHETVSHCLLHVVSHLGVVHASSILLLMGIRLLPLRQHPSYLGTAEHSSV